MTLREQVCTLEQAKRLKELGCKQKTSLFAWYWIRDNVNNRERFFLNMQPDELFPTICDAYTVAELGEMLIEHGCKMPYITPLGWTHECLVDFYDSKLEAQARAALLIHILEQEKEQELELDYVNIPPKSSRTVKARVVSVERGTPSLSDKEKEHDT